jgi:dienelactone hydrolase
MYQSNWPAQANTQGAVLLEPELAPASCASGGACNAEDSPNKQFVLDAVAYVEAHANINVSKVYLYGFSAGATQAMGVANGENRSAGAKYVTSDWRGLASTFAAFAIQAGALGGNASSPTNQTAANAPVFTTTAKPVIYITSKDDPTIQVDDGNSTHTTFQCAVQTSGTCQLKASAVNGYYAAHWGCTAPAKTTFGGHAFTSYDKWDFRCAASAAYEWVSLGVDATHGPNHSYASYNSATDIPSLTYGWLAAHS